MSVVAGAKGVAGGDHSPSCACWCVHVVSLTLFSVILTNRECTAVALAAPTWTCRRHTKPPTCRDSSLWVPSPTALITSRVPVRFFEVACTLYNHMVWSSGRNVCVGCGVTGTKKGSKTCTHTLFSQRVCRGLYSRVSVHQPSPLSFAASSVSQRGRNGGRGWV